MLIRGQSQGEVDGDGVALRIKSHAITLVPLLVITPELFVSVIGLPRMVCPPAPLNVIERKKLSVKSLVLTLSPGGKPPGNTRSSPFTSTPAGDQFAGADQLPEGSAPVQVRVCALGP